MCFTTMKRQMRQKVNFVLLIIEFYAFCGNTEMTNMHSSIDSLEHLLRHEIEFKEHLDGYIAEYNNTSNAVIDFTNKYYSQLSPHKKKSHQGHPSTPWAPWGTSPHPRHDARRATGTS